MSQSDKIAKFANRGYITLGVGIITVI